MGGGLKCGSAVNFALLEDGGVTGVVRGLHVPGPTLVVCEPASAFAVSSSNWQAWKSE